MAIGFFEPRTPTTDHRRAVELLRYLTLDDITPGSVSISAHNVPTIATQLQPYCQLVAMQCRSPRVMLNVMDQSMMYFLSEASQNENGADEFEDPIVQACSGAVPLQGRVCEMVIGMTATKDIAPTFVVNDLTQSRFNKLEVVTGPPYFRFYAGTPITTRDGVTIGSLAFMDIRTRVGMTKTEERCLTHVAALVMAQLEAHRLAIEGKRSMRLAQALEVFLAGEAAPPLKPWVRSASRHGTYGLNQPSSQAARSKTSPSHIFVRRPSLGPTEKTDEETECDDAEEMSPILAKEEVSPSSMYTRAASLMCQGFACADEDDMVLFVAVKTRSSMSPSGNQVQVLAGATPSRTFSADIDLPKLALQTDMLASLVQYYQDGCIFVLDELQLSSPDDAEDSVDRSKKRSRKACELRSLKDAFPHAKQVLFCPIWDLNLGSYNQAVFVSNSAQHLSLSPMIELSFLNSFCNSVATECTRADAIKAEKQKNDFVGTISHEMRSPLHGILASAEFLSDTQLSNYQQTLIDTVQSCGRTLLDTIDHVLDFSKISTFRNDWQAETKRIHGLNGQKRRSSQDTVASSAQPALLQLTSVVDMGVIVEEVVDSLILAQNFAANLDITDMTRQSRGRGTATPVLSTSVDVLIEIQPANWAFVTQPGAIRRIVLNLVGNAVKYTAKGQIIIRMELTGTDSQTMELTVIDTGQGIGRHFLDSLLFVPFAQENILAPGTGLGLSIVNNIVTMLGGSIDIQSTVGEGTTVKVVLPLQRPLPGQVSTTTTPQSGSTVSSLTSIQDGSIPWLQSQRGSLKAMVYKSVSGERFISRYLGQWYGFSLTDDVHGAHVIVTEKRDLERLRKILAAKISDHASAIIVLCSTVEKHETFHTKDVQSTDSIIEWVPTPVGPHKLAKAIRTILQREVTPRRTSLGPVDLTPISEWTSPVKPKPESTPNGHQAAHELADELLEMDLNRQDTNNPTLVVQATEQMAVSQTSQHSQQAIRSPKQSQEKGQEDAEQTFPFPDQDASLDKKSSPNIISSPQEKQVKQPIENVRVSIDPSVLVVDDNSINSSLLRSFLTKKRKYSRVDCATNGQEAVDLFTNSTVGYDIVFMDISMPIMDGFEATRAIRDYEKSSADRNANDTLVVALTGLSSIRDQAEGFEAGVDIYLTKPVLFKAVGQLLDNWELHRKVPPS